jgi:hypothetical protein
MHNYPNFKIKIKNKNKISNIENNKLIRPKNFIQTHTENRI